MSQYPGFSITKRMIATTITYLLMITSFLLGFNFTGVIIFVFSGIILILLIGSHP